jgi:SPP1 family phage portal protein
VIKVDFTDELSTDQLTDLLTENDNTRYEDNLKYYDGKNPTIVNRRLPVVNAPNHKLPNSYARKIIKTVVRYMYKPGLITYNIEDESYDSEIRDILLANNADTKTSAMGRQASIQGVAYELHYWSGENNQVVPRFAKIPVSQMIAVYSYGIEPELRAAIRHYRKDDEGQFVEVYYTDRVDYFFFRDKGGDKRLEPLGSEPHEYDSVPLVVFENNEERIGDFEPVKALIDAYDVLMSDSMNEFDRFAWAYLILKNVNANDQDANEVKYRKIIELLDDGEAKFLQKEIPSDYIRFMSEWIRKEIHKQTHVPDFTDSTLGTEMTGAAIDRLFYDFEFIAADKEDRFRDGLKRRFELINTIIRKSRLNSTVVDANDIEIVMGRNKPQMINELGEAGQYYIGRVSDETWLKQFAPFVDNVQEELEEIAEQGNPFRMNNGNTGFSGERPADTTDNGAPGERSRPGAD